MKGKIESGQLRTVEPIAEFESLQKGGIARVQGERCGIFAFDKSDSGKTLSNRQQSRTHKRLDWHGAIFGKCVKIED